MRRTGPRRALCVAVVATVVASACGSSASPALGTGRGAFRPGDGGEPAIAVARRHTPGRLRLALFVDVGSRDLGSGATLLAWALAERAGPDAVGTAYPDAIEIALPCATASLAACVEALARALALRETTGDDHARWVARLRGVARAAAADPAREAAELALAAALGEAQARALTPLPPPGFDAPTPETLSAWARAHLGPSRALVVGAGDVPERALREAVSAAFERAPGAEQPRAERALPAAVDREVPLRVRATPDGAEPRLAVAFGSSDPARAHGRGLAAARLIHGGASLIRVRGGAIAVVAAAPSAEPAEAVAALLRAHASWDTEGGPPPSPPPDEEGLAAAARAMGLDWASGETAGPARSWWGVGLRAPGEDEGELAARCTPDPGGPPERRPHEGVTEAETWTLSNGLDLTVEARPGPRVGLAILRRGGGAAEPAHQAGLTALLVETAAHACDGLGADAFDARLRALGATQRPIVTPGAHGRVLSAPVDRWREALDLAVDCAGSPRVSRADVEAARTRLTAPSPARAMRAWVGGLIAPDQPSVVAPWGDAQAVAEVDWRGVVRRAPSLRFGRGTHVALVGDVPVEDALRRLARRLRAWPAGEAAPPASEVDAPPGPARRFSWNGPTPRIVAVWTARGSGWDLASARLGAEALGESLGREGHGLAGARVVWAGGDASGGQAWAAVAFDAPDPSRLLKALDSWSPDLPATLAEQLARGARRYVEDGARAEVGAVRLALAGLGLEGAEAPPDPDRALEVARALRGGALSVGLSRR